MQWCKYWHVNESIVSLLHFADYEDNSGWASTVLNRNPSSSLGQILGTTKLIGEL